MNSLITSSEVVEKICRTSNISDYILYVCKVNSRSRSIRKHLVSHHQVLTS